VAQNVAADSTSDDSDSTDEGVAANGVSTRLLKMVKVSEDKAKLLEIDFRDGLNASHCAWSFPCLLDEE